MKHFARFRFDEVDRKLWSGADLVPLTRKAAEILACLIAHPGATVSHHTLMQTVWPDTHVQQDNIKVLVHELRHALGDSPASPRFIESESGRGYAFIAALARGFSGFGGALIFVPLASAAVGPQAAAPVLLVIDGIAQLALMKNAWAEADRRDWPDHSRTGRAPPGPGGR